jgi:hypothetical protein
MVKPFVYYYPLDLAEPEQGRLHASLKRLERLLAVPPCSISRLPRSAEKGVLAELQKTDLGIRDISGNVAETMFDEIGTLTTLVVRCSTDHPLAQTCLDADPDACWGLKNGGLAVVYDDREVALWHEVLHLLGAKDCYDLPADPGPTCEHPRCIMQYAPQVGEVQGKLQICPENAERIQRVLSQIAD